MEIILISFNFSTLTRKWKDVMVHNEGLSSVGEEIKIYTELGLTVSDAVS